MNEPAWSDGIAIGVSYYPEHWPVERWPEDIRLMKEAGIRVVRLAELAWSQLEPEEGRFAFDWLDRFIALAHAQGIRVVLGTPGEASPVWLRHRHPSVVRTDEFGRIHGGRGMHCRNNAAFARSLGRIVERMADRYAGNPAVIGWQIDNELRSVECYCAECAEGFRGWLKERYGTLDRLNGEWGTCFWSQSYNRWEEIAPPSADQLTVSVSQKLDFLRFCSDSTVGHLERQVRIIKARAPHQFVTHNTLGWYPMLDLYKLAEKLDFISWDSYPHVDADNVETAATHDLHRSVKRAPFWIMEQKNGYFNYSDYNLAIAPGVVRFWTYQDIARGANGVLYYRWRSNRFGVEQNPNGILRHDGTPRRVYGEIQALSRELARIERPLAATEVERDAAIVFSYDNAWAYETHKQYGNFDYREHLLSYYKAMVRLGLTADLVHPTEDLSRYRIVVVPALMMVNEAIAANLKRYAASGGYVIVTARSGIKTWANATIDTAWPGLLAELAGIVVDEFEVLPERYANTIVWNGTEYAVSVWLDMIEPVAAEPLAAYSGKFYAGRAAITRHAYGEGTVVYAGVMGNERLAADLVRLAAAGAGIRTLDLPEGIFVIRRSGQGNRFTFYLNATGGTKRFPLREPGTDAWTGRRLEGEAELDGYGVLIAQSATE